MKLIYGKIGTGKTTKLIQLSHENQYYIATMTKESANTLMKISKDLGLNIPFPITYKELLEGKFHAKNIKGILLDDADAFLSQISVNLIKMVSFTDDELIQL